MMSSGFNFSNFIFLYRAPLDLFKKFEDSSYRRKSNPGQNKNKSEAQQSCVGIYFTIYWSLFPHVILAIWNNADSINAFL